MYFRRYHAAGCAVGSKARARDVKREKRRENARRHLAALAGFRIFFFLRGGLTAESVFKSSDDASAECMALAAFSYNAKEVGDVVKHNERLTAQLFAEKVTSVSSPLRRALWERYSLV